MRKIQNVIMGCALALMFFTIHVLGQTITAKGNFSVLAPTIDFIGSIDNTVAYDTNYFASTGGLKWLHFGGSISNGVTINGIDCLATNVNMNGIDQITSYGFLAVQTIFNDTHALTKSDGSIVTTNKSDWIIFFQLKTWAMAMACFFLICRALPMIQLISPMSCSFQPLKVSELF